MFSNLFFLKKKLYPLVANKSAINLAAFRVVFFGFIFLNAHYEGFLWYATLPKELAFPPLGLGWAVKFLPLPQEQAIFFFSTLKFFAFMSSIGLFSRFSAFTTGLLLYVGSLGQIFGLVFHFDNIILFSILLGLSRCGDALAIDTLFKNNQLNKFNKIKAEDKNSYNLPFCFMWILMGVMYFFPGIWKLMAIKEGWLLQENLSKLILLLQSKMMTLKPNLEKIYQSKFLIMGGIATIIFEMTFVFFVLNNQFRKFLFFAGLLFHNLMGALIGIYFWQFQISYLSFLNWKALFFTKDKNEKPNLFSHFSLSSNKEIIFGKNKSLVFFGVLMILLNIFFGIIKKQDSWPFSCFPSFDYIVPSSAFDLDMKFYDKNNQEIDFSLQDLKIKHSSIRFSGLVEKIIWIEDPVVRNKKLDKLIEVIKNYDENENLNRAKTVYVYQIEKGLEFRSGELPILNQKLIYQKELMF